MSRMSIDALTKTTLIKLASELLQMNPLGRDGEWYKLKYIAGREAFRRALAEL